jgi:prolyl-tRNA synthetase
MVVRPVRAWSRPATKLRDELKSAGVRVALDDRADVPFGRRAVDAELKGIPVRVEVGPAISPRATP